MAMTPGRVLSPDPPPRDLEHRASQAGRGFGGKLKDQVAELEHRAIRQALDRTNGNRTKAARELGINEQALRYRLRKFEGTNGENRRMRRKQPARRKRLD
jgi:DNA-binding NtrC family response regulator